VHDHDHEHGHSHDHGHEHGYDHDEDPGPLEDNPIWRQDNVTLHSVGIDIGSSGTQVVFSRLHLRRISEELTSRYLVVRRDTLYRSPVELTPYRSAAQIDVGRLGFIVDRAYSAAGMTPELVDTGVVILTGEALRRANAEAIGSVLAEKAGDLVTATAGHHMEAMLAAYGSGAAKVSYDRGIRLLNIDVGGGTTKLAVVRRGEVEQTAAVAVGGRLVAFDESGRIARIDPAGRRHARRAGFDWALGDAAGAAEVEAVAELMAQSLAELVSSRTPAKEIAELWLTERLDADLLEDVDGVMFSGGVGEYVYDPNRREFGDLGRPLGHALRRAIESGALPFRLLPPGERIRATALGASEYSVQLSGNTSFITDPDALLPRRDVRVVRPVYDLGEDVDADAVGAAIRARLAALDADQDGANQDSDMALALSWSGEPGYERVYAFARGVRDGLAERIRAGAPIYLMLDGDIALTFGRLLRDELGVRNELLSIDGLSLREFDYIEIGRVRHPSLTVPVTIKSLVFHDTLG
jgi:ethanolamine utilization protein EutA